jgi:hypothetical protein
MFREMTFLKKMQYEPLEGFIEAEAVRSRNRSPLAIGDFP